MLKSTLKLCLVTHQEHHALQHYAQFIKQAVLGGVTMVQLRNKGKPAVVRELAITLIGLLRPLNVPLIINDDVEFAKEVDADGVHLGQSDLPSAEARRFLGIDKIIGLSIETLEQLEEANQLTCIDYIGASAVFPSQTKTDCKTIWGLNGLKKIASLSKHPVVAIGGIHAGNAQDVMKAGASGLAVVSAIHDHNQPDLAAMQLIREINKGNQNV